MPFRSIPTSITIGNLTYSDFFVTGVDPTSVNVIAGRITNKSLPRHNAWASKSLPKRWAGSRLPMHETPGGAPL